MAQHSPVPHLREQNRIMTKDGHLTHRSLEWNLAGPERRTPECLGRQKFRLRDQFSSRAAARSHGFSGWTKRGSRPVNNLRLSPPLGFREELVERGSEL
jgi:hypothetical protein